MENEEWSLVNNGSDIYACGIARVTILKAISEVGDIGYDSDIKNILNKLSEVNQLLSRYSNKIKQKNKL